jgi:hypothetical protein
MMKAEMAQTMEHWTTKGKRYGRIKDSSSTMIGGLLQLMASAVTAKIKRVKSAVRRIRWRIYEGFYYHGILNKSLVNRGVARTLKGSRFLKNPGFSQSISKNISVILKKNVQFHRGNN